MKTLLNSRCVVRRKNLGGSSLGFAIALSGMMLAVSSLQAENWANWRGPNFNGSSPEKNLPITFSKTENVVWTAPVPGPSGSTPIVWGDYVFVASTDEAERSCVAL